MGYCYENLKSRIANEYTDKQQTVLPILHDYADLFLPAIIQAQEICNFHPVKKNNLFFINTGTRSKNNFSFALSLAEIQQFKLFLAKPENEPHFYKLNGIPDIELKAANYSTLKKEQKDAIDFLSIKKIELDSLYAYFNILYDMVKETYGIVYMSDLAVIADFPIYVNNEQVTPSQGFFSNLINPKKFETEKKIYFSDSTMQRINEINLVAAMLRSQG